MKFLCSFMNMHKSNSKTNLSIMEDEVKRQIPKAWSEQLIDFNGFSEFIKNEIQPNNLKLNSNDKESSNYIDILNTRFEKLQHNTTVFLKSINEATSKFNNFFLQQINQLSNSSIKIEEKATAADSLSNIQSILYLTYFKLAIILDKFDNASSLSIGDSFLDNIVRQNSVFHAETSEKINNTIRTFKSIESNDNEIDTSRNYEMIMITSTDEYANILKQVFAIFQKYNVNVIDFQVSKTSQNVVSVSLILDLNFQFIEMYNNIKNIISSADASVSVRALGSKTLLIKEEKEKETKEGVKENMEDIYKNYVATLINDKKLDSEFLNHWFQFLADNKIIVKRVRRLNRATEPNIRCMDVFLDIPKQIEIDVLKKQIFELTSTYKTDIALQVDDVYRKNKRLIVFDMDSTLIQQECIDEIARHAGVVKEVSVRYKIIY